MSEAAQRLWDELTGAGLVQGPMPPAAAHSPWYVRGMLGVAGWIASLFLLGFAAMTLESLMRSPGGAFVTGLLLIAVAWPALRAAGEFQNQLGLAFSLVGQGLIAFAVLDGMHDGPAGWLLLAGIEAALALVVPGAVHRGATALFAGLLLWWGLAQAGAGALGHGLLAAAVAAVWLAELGRPLAGELLRPVGYGLTLALLPLEAMLLDGSALGGLLHDEGWWRGGQLGPALVALSLLAVVFQLLVRQGIGVVSRIGLAALAGAAAVGAASFQASGLAAGFMLLLLGFAGGHRPLLGIATLSLLGFLCAYYYLLELTLLSKAGTLAATGAVLLTLRGLLPRLLEESDHA